MAHLRIATVDDVPAFAQLRNAIYPYKVESIAAQQKGYTLIPDRAQMVHWIAEVAGQPVAMARAGLNYSTSQPGQGVLTVLVLPEHRGQGIGSALLATASDHLAEIGAQAVRTWGPEDPDNIAFAVKHGFTPAREMRYSKVDPRLVPAPPPTPDGIRLVSVREAGIKAIYAFECLAVLDQPRDVPAAALPLDEWIALYWEGPDQQHDLGVIAMSDDIAVAGTFVVADLARARSCSGFTGVLREHRGRGLAKLVKTESLRRVAAAGITAAFTSNDETNAPMLAVNTWLGYQPTAAERSFTK